MTKLQSDARKPIVILVLAMIGCRNISTGFTVPSPSTSSSSALSWQLYSSVAKTSEMMQEMRQKMEEDEDTNLMMQALRGSNMNDDEQAAQGVEMKLVEVDEGTGLPLAYDPIELEKFFSPKPFVVLKRVAQVLAAGGGFFLKAAVDAILKRDYKKNPDLEIKRAGELRDLITSLGPFYIKLGQALSIRPDLLSPRSMVEMQKLCDKVPSYDSKIAFATIERELGKTVNEVFSEITPEPVAAASLGQVYQATLRTTGESVAVKVQRPGVLETVSLDLYLFRQIGLFARNFPALSDRLDAVALLDEFAFRFYQELDYVLECENGIRMKKEMSILPKVVIPGNFPDYTSRRVHVAEWIDGEKLSQCTADDVGALVNLGVITYLTQLLEYGFLHSDPHPGNMLRTNDGKLCILDFGLMTEITDNQKYGMIEAIAHLINRDYDEIGEDFINLDFIPRGTDTKPIVPALKKVFDVALAGGGAKSINFQELAAELAQITYDYPFSIPPYFALIIRAISVLEGIALVGNPNFAIIDEAYPYIARRLMTDDSPRLKAALRYMVYGKEGSFDAENLIDLLQALEKFTAVRDDGDGSAFKVDGVRGAKFVGNAGDFAGSQKVDFSDRETDVGNGRFRVNTNTNNSNEEMLTTAVDDNNSEQKDEDEQTVGEALKFFFSPDGQVFREFMLEEIVTVVDASSRDAILELSKALGLNNLPVPSFFRALSPELSDQDKQMVQQIQKLVQFLLGDFEGAITDENSGNNPIQRLRNNASNERLRVLIPVMREYAPQLRQFGTLLVVRLSEKNISRGLNWASSRLAPV
eukprot:CAMPEP_0197826354 /NCGR_PEP_ID=MMETSP1437-20131217/3325_1 /TAXON_ID=49252 ORGANISM="Eucampia antarctica, Strain CCMP1452" /NCGR_SAMPLE_ID=MMETSP1437 /ASSEMBLY_ACC=CAM_ASM_001096 /LENGTH=810 /DNA_ID=CAMNT_0043426761 /DNA_START=196 /DNA_END=2628 /DNA_ORIENTATION=+